MAISLLSNKSGLPRITTSVILFPMMIEIAKRRKITKRNIHHKYRFIRFVLSLFWIRYLPVSISPRNLRSPSSNLQYFFALFIFNHFGKSITPAYLCQVLMNDKHRQLAHLKKGHECNALNYMYLSDNLETFKRS